MLVAKNWKTCNISSKKKWLVKCQHVMLKNKLSAISHLREGQLNGVTSFTKIWLKFVMYWNSIKPQNTIQQKILEQL